jgi:hypothetical protein
MSAAAKQGDDNSVAILALIVGGVVGIVGPVISAAVLAWRSTREVSAARQRQDANNAAAATNLETQLTAERERLQLQLYEERKRLSSLKPRTVQRRVAVLCRMSSIRAPESSKTFR